MKIFFYNILSLRPKINALLTLKKKEAMHIKKLSHNKLAKGMTAPSLRAPTRPHCHLVLEFLSSTQAGNSQK